MANPVTHICTHQLQSGALRFDAAGALSACLVCDQRGAVTRELPAYEARKLKRGCSRDGRSRDSRHPPRAGLRLGSAQPPTPRRGELRPRRAAEAPTANVRALSMRDQQPKEGSLMSGYKFLLEVDGLDHPVWQHGYGQTEAECRRDAEARAEQIYGGRATTAWAQSRLEADELRLSADEPVPESGQTAPQPAKDELYWHMEVDAWLAQLSEIHELPERSSDDLT